MKTSQRIVLTVLNEAHSLEAVIAAREEVEALLNEVRCLWFALGIYLGVAVFILGMYLFGY